GSNAGLCCYGACRVRRGTPDREQRLLPRHTGNPAQVPVALAVPVVLDRLDVAKAGLRVA
ncbi:MAG: hypothetical protein FWD57_13990, partial [Polyangiaceae bacterium]|nr:hypothetical protein [Polyangiaceae bacterium]